MSVNSKMTTLADAIRAKSGVEGKLSLDGMTQAVNSIETGADVTLGMVNDDLDFQPVRFEGKDAVPEGIAIPVSAYYSWNTNAITLSDVPVISGMQYSAIEFDLSEYASAVNGKVKFSSSDLPDGLSLDGSVIKGNPSVYGSFASSVTVSSKGASDKALNVLFEIEEVQMPGGAVFYAPLDSTSETAVTGQTLVPSGSQSYTTFSGVPCMLIESGYIETAENSGIEGTASRTVSFWAYPTNSSTYCAAVSIGGTSQSSGQLFNCGTRLSGASLNYGFTAWGNDIDKTFGTADNRLHHFAYVYNSETPGTLTVYVDGVPNTHSVSGIRTVNGKFRLGTSTASGWPYTGYLAGVRVYDRVLKEEEIQLLANEFTPVA